MAFQSCWFVCFLDVSTDALYNAISHFFCILRLSRAKGLIMKELYMCQASTGLLAFTYAESKGEASTYFHELFLQYSPAWLSFELTTWPCPDGWFLSGKEDDYGELGTTAAVICQLSCPLRTLYGSKGPRPFYGKKLRRESIQVKSTPNKAESVSKSAVCRSAKLPYTAKWLCI